MSLFSSITGFNAIQAKVYEKNFSKNDVTDYSEVDYCNNEFKDFSNSMTNVMNNFAFDDEPTSIFDMKG